MPETDHLRRHALECLRLAADCEQLARDVQNPDLAAHFDEMAELWSKLAERGPSADTGTLH